MNTDKLIPVIPMMQGKLAVRVEFKGVDRIFICLKTNDGSFQHAQTYQQKDLQILKEQIPFLAFEFPTIDTAVDFAKSFYLNLEDKIRVRDHLQKCYQKHIKSLTTDKMLNCTE